MHVAFYDTRNSGAGVRDKTDFYYVLSTNGGTSWIEETRVTAATSPNINDGQEWGDYNGLSTAAGNATVGMTWTDNRAAQRSFIGRVTNVGAGATYLMNVTPTTISACAGTPLPPINLSLSGITGYTGTVTLSTPGIDGAAFPSATFSPNPVVNPAGGGTPSVLTVTTAGGAATGNYAINWVSDW